MEISATRMALHGFQLLFRPDNHHPSTLLCAEIPLDLRRLSLCSPGISYYPPGLAGDILRAYYIR
jgi:hypothetical protein